MYSHVLNLLPACIKCTEKIATFVTYRSKRAFIQ